MKALTVSSDRCLISRNPYGVDINGKSVVELINENLPKELKDYDKYSARINISIEIWDEEDMKISNNYQGTVLD